MDQFAHPRLDAYEDFVLEIRIPSENYERLFRDFEVPYVSEIGRGTQVVIPQRYLDLLNSVGHRLADGLEIRYDEE